MNSAVVKTELGPEKICFKRERENYKLPAIADCQYVRALYDVIGPDEGDAQVFSTSETDDPVCMVFEWMDHDLRTVSSDQFRQHSNLPKVIAKSVLSALALFKAEYNGIHTGKRISLFNVSMAESIDINPNNIFLSNINTLSPIVKVGDLGNCAYLTDPIFKWR
jgi:serine/threonine protein kinase